MGSNGSERPRDEPYVRLYPYTVYTVYRTHLYTPLLRPEFIQIPCRMIPDTTIATHSLTPYVHQNAILFEVNKGMYGLLQAGLLAQQRLIAHLANHGYHEIFTSCLFWHTSNGTAFTLVVDDYGIKYSSKAGADHLICTLQLLYVITINWTGSSYIGFTIVFNNTSRQVSLTMPGYISKVLEQFAPHLCIGAASPAVYIPPSYGAPTQNVTSDTSSLLPPLAIKRLQEQVGCLLYYARGVDATILPAVNHIASLQSQPTVIVAAAMCSIVLATPTTHSFSRLAICDSLYNPTLHTFPARRHAPSQVAFSTLATTTNQQLSTVPV